MFSLKQSGIALDKHERIYEPFSRSLFSDGADRIITLTEDA